MSRRSSSGTRLQGGLGPESWEGARAQAMIANCNILGKPVVITRLVDTMGSNPRPTRHAAAPPPLPTATHLPRNSQFATVLTFPYFGPPGRRQRLRFWAIGRCGLGGPAAV